MNHSWTIEGRQYLLPRPDNTNFYVWWLFSLVVVVYWNRHKSWHSHPVKRVPPITPAHPATSLSRYITTSLPETVKQAPSILNAQVFQDYVLVSRTDLSHNVSVFRLGLPQRTDVLGLPPGQHIALAFTDTTSGQLVSRSYTPISTDQDRGYFDVLVKLYPDGQMSRHLQTLQVRDTLKARGPKGAMLYRPGLCERIGMIAGGSGITPMLQIIKAVLAQRPADTTWIDLIYANRTREDIILKDVLDDMADKDPAFNVHYVLSQPPEDWSGLVGHVTKDLIKEKLPSSQDSGTKIMLCGPPGMLNAMKVFLEDLGFDKARLVGKKEDQVFCF